MQFMLTAGNQPFTWVTRVKTFVYFPHRIYPFEISKCSAHVSGVNVRGNLPAVQPGPRHAARGCPLPAGPNCTVSVKEIQKTKLTHNTLIFNSKHKHISSRGASCIDTHNSYPVHSKKKKTYGNGTKGWPNGINHPEIVLTLKCEI